MGLFGPFSAVANTVQRCDISSDAEGIYVINTSRFDLGVAFQSFQPAPITSFGGDPWFGTVPSGDRRGIRIPARIYGANGFPGYVYVNPVDNSAKLAQSGTASSSPLFYIESVADARYMPPDYASPRFQDLASQPRMIDVPISAFPAVGSWTPAAGGATTLVQVEAIQPANFTNTVIQTYIYSLAIFQIPQSSISELDASLQIVLLNAGNVVVAGPIDVFRFAVASGVNTSSSLSNSPVVYCPSHAAKAPINISGVAPVTVALRLFSNSQLGNPVIAYNIAWNSDGLNAGAVPDIGNSSLAIVGPSGANLY